MIRFIVRLYHPNSRARNITERECINPDVLHSKIEQARIELLEVECDKLNYHNIQNLMDLGYSTRAFIEIDEQHLDYIKGKSNDQVPTVPNTQTESSGD